MPSLWFQDPGKLKVQTYEFPFKTSKLYISQSNIESMEWFKGAQGYGVKIIKQDGNLVEFDGLKEVVGDTCVCVCVCVCVCSCADLLKELKEVEFTMEQGNL